MGNNYTSEYMTNYINSQMTKIKKNKSRTYLNLTETQKFIPPDKLPISTKHLGILYILDSNKSGKFTFQKFFDFWLFCNKLSKKYHSYELHFLIQSSCLEKLANDLKKKDKEKKIKDWVILNLKIIDNKNTEFFSPNIEYVQFEFIEPLFDIFQVNILKTISIQDLFYLMQRAAEENNLLDINCVDLDHYVPLCIVEEFVASFLNGVKDVYLDICINEKEVK